MPDQVNKLGTHFEKKSPTDHAAERQKENEEEIMREERMQLQNLLKW